MKDTDHEGHEAQTVAQEPDELNAAELERVTGGVKAPVPTADLCKPPTPGAPNSVDYSGSTGNFSSSTGGEAGHLGGTKSSSSKPPK